MRFGQYLADKVRWKKLLQLQCVFDHDSPWEFLLRLPGEKNQVELIPLCKIHKDSDPEEIKDRITITFQKTILY